MCVCECAVALGSLFYVHLWNDAVDALDATSRFFGKYWRFMFSLENLALCSVCVCGANRRREIDEWMRVCVCWSTPLLLPFGFLSGKRIANAWKHISSSQTRIGCAVRVFSGLQQKYINIHVVTIMCAGPPCDRVRNASHCQCIIIIIAIASDGSLERVIYSIYVW